jgi:hypothetical protein
MLYNSMAFTENHKKAPDAGVTMFDGSTHNLRDFWKDKPLFLIFLRHFG